VWRGRCSPESEHEQSENKKNCSANHVKADIASRAGAGRIETLMPLVKDGCEKRQAKRQPGTSWSQTFMKHTTERVKPRAKRQETENSISSYVTGFAQNVMQFGKSMRAQRDM
jgi:hypothetical protein